jgi:hypothetical protein
VHRHRYDRNNLIGYRHDQPASSKYSDMHEFSIDLSQLDEIASTNWCQFFLVRGISLEGTVRIKFVSVEYTYNWVFVHVRKGQSNLPKIQRNLRSSIKLIESDAKYFPGHFLRPLNIFQQ